MMSVYGERIIELRKRKNMSQQELADLAGVSQTSIYQWEKGTRKPKVENMVKIAELLQVSINDLFGEIIPDVVQVVRCKDCRFSEHEKGSDALYCVRCGTIFTGLYDYCSKGELR